MGWNESTAVTLPEEHMLVLRIAEFKTVKLLCTNARLVDLVIGYLFNEGVVDGLDDVASLFLSADGSAGDVRLKRAPGIAGDAVVRLSGLGGEGLACGGEVPACPAGRRYAEDDVRGAAACMDRSTVLYRQTGGMHCSALFRDGRKIAQREDIGRHNTLDKLAGSLLLRSVDASDSLLVTSGRISSDMVRKASRMGVVIIASYSTATTAAYEVACSAGMTLVAYVNHRPYQVLCGEDRLVSSSVITA